MIAEAKPTAYWDSIFWPSSAREMTVHEKEPEFSGLLDQHGRRLMKARAPIGFVNFDLLRREARK